MGWLIKKIDINDNPDTMGTSGNEGDGDAKLKDFPGLRKQPSDTGSVNTVMLEKMISSLDSSVKEMIIQGRDELKAEVKALKEENILLKKEYIKKPPSPMKDDGVLPKTYDELKTYPLKCVNYYERYFMSESSTNFTIRLELWAFLTLIVDLSASGEGKLVHSPAWYYNKAVDGIEDRKHEFNVAADKEGLPLAVWVNDNINF